MTDLSLFDANGASNPKNNIFGLPFSEDEARLVILPVPWEVTVSYGAGTSRAAEHVFRASMQVDLFDAETNSAWQKGFFMRQPDRKVLMKSDYLNNGKLVALLGGDHSTALGYFKAIAEKYGDFGILQIDAHCDLRKSYENFVYSHASIMYNALQEIPQLKRLVQVGVRDYAQEEWDYIRSSNYQVITYFDKDIKERGFEGQSWKQIADEIVSHLPEKVYISFDIDGLDPKLCPSTGTPVPGGFEAEQIFYLIRKIVQSGRRFIGFDLAETAVGDTDWDANLGARILWKLCNLLFATNPC